MGWSSAPAVVRGKRIVLPDGAQPASVHIQNGRIARIGPFEDQGTPGQDVLDVHDLYVLPGLVDTHVHVNEPGRADWEGFATATAAAAAGGVTTLLDMPLNSVPATTNVRALERKRRDAKGKCAVDVGFLAGVVPGNEAQLAPLWEAGVFAFKCFLVPSGVDEFRNVSAEDLDRGLRELSRLNAPLMVHAELSAPIEAAWPALMGRDARRYATYLASRPSPAETDAVRLVIELARKHSARVHIVHVSSAASLPLLSGARESGVRITAETCPHYLSLSAEDVPDGATEFKCAPPIREVAHRDALWQGLRDGTLDAIVSDHSPCPPQLKRKDTGDFFQAWGGISSLELGASIVATELRGLDLGIAHLARWMSTGPAALAGLEGRKGALVAGADADLVIFDADAPFVVNAAALHQRHKVTPYDRRELYGRVRATYLGGALVFADGRLVGQPSGRLLSRTT